MYTSFEVKQSCNNISFIIKYLLVTQFTQSLKHFMTPCLLIAGEPSVVINKIKAPLKSYSYFSGVSSHLAAESLQVLEVFHNKVDHFKALLSVHENFKKFYTLEQQCLLLETTLFHLFQ